MLHRIIEEKRTTHILKVIGSRDPAGQPDTGHDFRGFGNPMHGAGVAEIAAFHEIGGNPP